MPAETLETARAIEGWLRGAVRPDLAIRSFHDGREVLIYLLGQEDFEAVLWIGRPDYGRLVDLWLADVLAGYKSAIVRSVGDAREMIEFWGLMSGRRVPDESRRDELGH